jgi:hypothetical protein
LFLKFAEYFADDSLLIDFLLSKCFINMLTKLSLLALFGIAMAHFEGVVVVYLRKALGLLDSDSNKESIGKFPVKYLHIEMTREAATIIMLVVIALLVGND